MSTVSRKEKCGKTAPFPLRRNESEGTASPKEARCLPQQLGTSSAFYLREGEASYLRPEDTFRWIRMGMRGCLSACRVPVPEISPSTRSTPPTARRPMLPAEPRRSANIEGLREPGSAA